MKKYSTSEVAKMLDVQRPNLQRAIKNGVVKPPPINRVGGVKVRLWSKADVERARKALKIKNGRRKKKATK